MTEPDRLKKDGRQRITDAFVRLLQDHEIDDIPVKALIHEARVHRSTFYYHFTGYDDIASQLMEEFMKSVRDEMAHVGEAPKDANAAPLATDASVRILAFVRERGDVFRAILKSSRGDELRRRLVEALYDSYRSVGMVFFDVSGGEFPLSKVEYDYYLYTSAHEVLACLEMWCERDFVDEPGYLVELYTRFRDISTEQGVVRKG